MLSIGTPGQLKRNSQYAAPHGDSGPALPRLPLLLLQLLLLPLLAPATDAAAGASAASGNPYADEAQLSLQTREWWRWVVTRVANFAGWIDVHQDHQRARFMDEWDPDLFDWYGDVPSDTPRRQS